jgi:hypothetical protein
MCATAGPPLAVTAVSPSPGNHGARADAAMRSVMCAELFGLISSRRMR